MALGSALELLLSPTTELVFASCIKSTFYHTSQSYQEVVHYCCVELEKMTLKNDDFFGQLMRHPGEGDGTPLQYSCLENPMDGGAWWAAVHGVAKSRAQLSDFTLTFHFHALEKEMATHSSVLAWRIPGTGEPGGLPSMGLRRVGHD